MEAVKYYVTTPTLMRVDLSELILLQWPNISGAPLPTTIALEMLSLNFGSISYFIFPVQISSC